jgi:ribonucleoside-triphosphate reductase (thioredoxin)
VRSLEEFKDVAVLLYKTCKAITRMTYLYEETNEVIHRNSRIGIGITGIVEATDKMENWADAVYKHLREFDNMWSDLNNTARSIKLTTVKPSGTLSLLAGVTPGVHPAYAQYYIRRVRMASDDALVEYCRAKGYDVEYARNFDGSTDYNTSIVSFPAKSSETAILAKDMTAIRQLELVKRAQTLWSDSSVSVTVYYRKEELPAIKEWLAENYENSVKSVSFLLHSDHGFDQAPYEEITEELYNELSTRVKLTEAYNEVGDMLSIEDCEGGACPVR